MSLGLEMPQDTFIDRRSTDSSGTPPARERRQFSDGGRMLLSADAQELATAIDNYKLMHRRRFITYEEMLSVIQSLGYHR